MQMRQRPLIVTCRWHHHIWQVRLCAHPAAGGASAWLFAPSCPLRIASTSRDLLNSRTSVHADRCAFRMDFMLRFDKLALVKVRVCAFSPAFRSSPLRVLQEARKVRLSYLIIRLRHQGRFVCAGVSMLDTIRSPRATPGPSRCG